MLDMARNNINEDRGNVAHVPANVVLTADKKEMALELTNRIAYREQVKTMMMEEVIAMGKLIDKDLRNEWNLNDLRSLRTKIEIHLRSVDSEAHQAEVYLIKVNTDKELMKQFMDNMNKVVSLIRGTLMAIHKKIAKAAPHPALDEGAGENQGGDHQHRYLGSPRQSGAQSSS